MILYSCPFSIFYVYDLIFLWRIVTRGFCITNKDPRCCVTNREPRCYVTNKDPRCCVTNRTPSLLRHVKRSSLLRRVQRSSPGVTNKRHSAVRGEIMTAPSGETIKMAAPGGEQIKMTAPGGETLKMAAEMIKININI